MTRYLSPAENMLHEHLTTRSVTAWTVRDKIDAEVLAKAFHSKLMEHPSLRSTISRDANGFFLRPLEGELPTLNVLDCSLEDEINTPLSGGALVRITLLHDKTVVLHVHHAISDGHSITALAESLWKCYAHGGPQGDLVRQYPDPIEACLPQHPAEDVANYVTRQTFAAQQSVARLPTAGTATGRTRIEVLRLTRAETDRFIDRASYAGIGVHGMLCGVLLHQLRPHLEPATGPVACLSAVDLRSRVTPLLPKEQMVLGASWHTSVVELSDDPLAIGRAVLVDLRAAIKRGDPERALLAIPHTPPDTSVLRPCLSISNLGHVPAGCADVWVAAIPDRSFESPGHGRLRVTVLTSDDRLCLVIAHDPGLFEPHQVRTYLAAVREELCADQ